MEELQEFIALWEEVTRVQRLDDVEDVIKWKWTQDGQYTTKSAYQTDNNLDHTLAIHDTSTHPNLESASRAEMQDLCMDSPSIKDNYDQQPSQTRMAT
jgi:hypothetical protein